MPRDPREDERLGLSRRSFFFFGALYIPWRPYVDIASLKGLDLLNVAPGEWELFCAGPTRNGIYEHRDSFGKISPDRVLYMTTMNSRVRKAFRCSGEEGVYTVITASDFRRQYGLRGIPDERLADAYLSRSAMR